jgi:N-acetylmuramoyl-L-alanine amidase CwlA
MEFVTIHDLSRELNVPARVIRYRLIQLIAEGKLKENDDFRRDDFKDEQHFLWKIHPLSFMQKTGLKPVTAVNHVDNHLATTATKTDNQSLPTVDQSPNDKAPADTKPSSTVDQPDNHSSTTVNESGNKSLEREMIDLLKEQVKVKDGQIHEQGEQLKDLNDLNVKLTGTMLQQNQKIENLLRLTGGKSDMVSDQPANQEDLAEAA